MGKKRKSDDFYDDMNDEVLDITDNHVMQQSQPLFGGLIPNISDNYKSMEVEVIQKELEAKSKSLIRNIISVYYKSGEIEKPDYLDTVEQVEAMNLQNLLLQVRASEHLLVSLLNRLNATGSIDNSLYKLISETQKDSIALTMQVSNYVRSLPTYFKQLRFELETNIDMVNISPTQEMIEQKQDAAESDDDFVKKPQKGMRSFLKQVEEMRNELTKENETIEENINIPNKNKEDNLTTEEAEMRARLLSENEE